MTNCAENAKILRSEIEKIGRFKILSKDIGVPVVAFSLIDSSDHDEFEISDGLRRYGWTVPAYTMAPDAQHVTLLRVVVREDFSRSLADRLVTDIKRVLAYLDARPSKLIQAVTEAVQAESKEKAVPLASTASGVKATEAFVEVVHHSRKKKHHSRGHTNKKHSLHKANGVC